MFMCTGPCSAAPCVKGRGVKGGFIFAPLVVTSWLVIFNEKDNQLKIAARIAE